MALPWNITNLALQASDLHMMLPWITRRWLNLLLGQIWGTIELKNKHVTSLTRLLTKTYDTCCWFSKDRVLTRQVSWWELLTGEKLIVDLTYQLRYMANFISSTCKSMIHKTDWLEISADMDWYRSLTLDGVWDRQTIGAEMLFQENK